MAEVEFTDNSPKILSAFEAQVRAALVAIGNEARDYAVDECPVDTGLLRNSLAYAIAGEAPDKTGYEADKGDATGEYSGSTPEEPKGSYAVYIGSNVKYAAVQEFGDFNHTTGKQHFLKDAITNHTDRYKMLAEAALKK